MKNQLHSNLLIRAGLTLTLTALLWVPLQAQSPMSSSDKPMMRGKMMDGQPTRAEHRQAMLERHQTMMAEMNAQNAELTALVAQMNSAAADKKLDLMAGIVTQLVAQRTVMNQRMGMMQGELMNRAMPGMPMDREELPEHSMMQDSDKKDQE